MKGTNENLKQNNLKLLLRVSLYNFAKEEIFLTILVTRGSIIVKNCFMIVVYNENDKLKIGKL